VFLVLVLLVSVQKKRKRRLLMSVNVVNKPVPASTPLIPSSSPGSPVALLAGFPPSAELGEQLRNLQEAQAVVDQRQAAELARLREIQNRD
jgi:hypothetical protein